MHSLPEGAPTLVQPTLQKQDIPQMKKDLHKYDAAGVYTAEATQRWERLLAEFPTKYGELPEIEPPWIVDEIQPATNRLPCDDTPTVIPEKVSQKAKATQEHRQV